MVSWCLLAEDTTLEPTWTNILCSYAATRAPSENGLIFSTKIEFEFVHQQHIYIYI